MGPCARKTVGNKTDIIPAFMALTMEETDN